MNLISIHIGYFILYDPRPVLYNPLWSCTSKTPFLSIRPFVCNYSSLFSLDNEANDEFILGEDTALFFPCLLLLAL